ncbi:hypothetical protein EB796_015717 [Bugula neritina]|uniref:Uncharacterized protein n=1 Tax=Bugula neritina TaxID=10212 RepID=A0A7J7JI12_BUGNE|nr:hypothetical protein EB796_015717 [Bugula neritina]
MRDFLFNKKLDIVSININRGRDHGFRSYVDYRKYYRLSVPQSWKDLEKTHSKEVVNQLKTVYTSVKDVELYIAGITEKRLSGALVGELFANIIGDGFSRSKKGDRFYFESSQSGLTAAQIASIKRYTYAQVLCEGLSMDKIVNKVFFRNGQKGAREVSCSSFPSLDFKLWKTKGSSDSNSKKCYWKVTKTGKCCKGRRTVYRTCVNSSSSCRCPGSSKASEKCSGSYNRRSKC